MSMYYSPLRYPGGKNSLFPFISKFFYENDLIGISYAEPYAGGAGLALRLLSEGYVDHIYINDLDKSIYSFWKYVLDYPDDFCAWIENVEVTISTWKTYRGILANSKMSSYVELAKALFFLNRTNVSGIIKGGVIGGIDQKGKYKIDARFNKKDLIRRIKKIASIKDRISVSNIDGLLFIDKLNKDNEDIFIYLDPPYYQKGANLYMNFYTKQDHLNLSKYVRTLRKKWIVSYDNHDFILNLYSEQKKIMYKVSQSASNRVGDEILIFSNNLVFEESMNALNSPVLY